MDDYKKETENIVLSVVTALSKIAEDCAMNADPGEMLNDADYDQIARKIMSSLAITNRAKLHVTICLAEIIELSEKMAKSLIQDKVKRATTRAAF